MADFIMEFLDWLADAWNCFCDSAWDIAKVVLAVVFVILTIPIWLLPFAFWLVFVKWKGGGNNGK